MSEYRTRLIGLHFFIKRHAVSDGRFNRLTPSAKLLCGISVVLKTIHYISTEIKINTKHGETANN